MPRLAPVISITPTPAIVRAAIGVLRHARRSGLRSTVPGMAVRLDESDEYMHELGPESNFNESMYINCFDPAQGVGGWFRMGNRAERGHRRDDGVPVPARRGRGWQAVGRVHVQASGDRQQRRVRRRRHEVDHGQALRGAEGRLRRQGRAARRARADGRSQGGVHEQPVRRGRDPPHVHRSGQALDVRWRARRAAREAGRGVRQGSLRAADRCHRHDQGRRTRVGHQRFRPARPFVGPPLLAGAVVLPLADGQRRRELRLHGQPGGEEGRPWLRAAASSGRTA